MDTKDILSLPSTADLTNSNKQSPLPHKKRRLSNPKKTDAELVTIFWAAPLNALFGREAIAPVVNRNTKTLESDRWRGNGIPYRRCGGRVLYRKADVVAWIESHSLVVSTSQACGKE